MSTAAIAVIEQAVLAARAARDADVDLAAQSDADLAEIVALTAEMWRLAGAQLVAVAAEITERETRPASVSFCRSLGYRSPAAMLAEQFGMRRGSAMQVLAIADASLPKNAIDDASALRFPRLSRSVLDGAASIEQASAFLTGIGSVAGHDPAALDDADTGFVALATDDERPMSPEQLAKVGRALAATLDDEGIEPSHDDLRALRRASFTRLDDGTWRLSAILDPEQAAVMQHVVDAYASPRRSVRFDDDADHDLSQEAGDDRTLPQRRVDALTDMVALHAASGTAPTVGGRAPTLIVTATYSEMMAAQMSSDPSASAPTIADVLAGAIPAATARLVHTGDIVPIDVASRILCSGAMQLAIMSDDGEVLELGRSQRLFSKAQLLAMVVRDTTCRAPGCTMPAERCEGHHIVWWSRGGPTDISNGIMLCRFHHAEVHAGRLTIGRPATSGAARARHPWVVQRTKRRPRRTLAQRRRAPMRT